MIELLVAIVPLLLAIYKEYLSVSASARASQIKFQLDQATLKAIVDSAVDNWNAGNAGNSKGASTAWDAADKEQDKDKIQ